MWEKGIPTVVAPVFFETKKSEGFSREAGGGFIENTMVIVSKKELGSKSD